MPSFPSQLSRAAAHHGPTRFKQFVTLEGQSAAMENSPRVRKKKLKLGKWFRLWQRSVPFPQRRRANLPETVLTQVIVLEQHNYGCRRHLRRQ